MNQHHEKVQFEVLGTLIVIVSIATLPVWVVGLRPLSSKSAPALCEDSNITRIAILEYCRAVLCKLDAKNRVILDIEQSDKLDKENIFDSNTNAI